MSILISTLKEELATAKRLEKKYLTKIKELPRGSFITRSVRGKQYGYLTFRENGRVKQEYLGSLNKEQIGFYRKAKTQRAEYKLKLKSVREQIIIINRALRGKTK
ncbi:MAG: putative integrase [Deltaproteobacteria bacterium]|nr:putative integrase [Deltaproteobacteria bacterium]